MLVSNHCLFKDFSITWLLCSDKMINFPTKLFKNFTDEIIKEYGIENGIETSLSVFLLEAEGKKALFDTGLNEKESTGLPDRLKELKISSEEIDYIFITHFHPDHIGGLITKDDKIYFENAKIYVSKDEYDAWINQPDTDKNALAKKVMKICEKNVIKFDFEGTLPLGVRPIKAFGHTKGHTVFQKGDFIVIGDIIHGQDVQWEHPEICPAIEYNEQESIETRKTILKYAKDNKLLVGGMHLKYSKCSMFREYYQNK